MLSSIRSARPYLNRSWFSSPYCFDFSKSVLVNANNVIKVTDHEPNTQQAKKNM